MASPPEPPPNTGLAVAPAASIPGCSRRRLSISAYCRARWSSRVNENPQIEAKAEGVLCTESQIHVFQPDEAADEKPRANHEHDGKRHFAANEKAARTPAGLWRGSTAIAEAIRESGRESRANSEQQRRQQGNDNVKENDPRVDSQVGIGRDCLGREPQQCSAGRGREEQPEQPSEHGKQQVFREELTNQAATARASALRMVNS